MRTLMSRLVSFRAFMVYALLVAIAVTVAVQYRVSLRPLELRSRTVEYGIADAQLIGDLPRARIGRSGVYPQEPLNRRVALFASFLTLGPVQNDLLRRLDLPRGSGTIAVVGNTLLRRSGRRDPGPTSVEQLESLPGRTIALATTLRTNVPVLTITARAPTERGAQRVAEEASRALSDYVLTLPITDIRSESLVTLGLLGPAETRKASTGPVPRESTVIGIAAAIGLLLLWLLARSVLRRGQAPAARYASTTRRAVSDHG